MPNFRSAGAEIFDSEKRIGRKENRAAGAKKRPSVIAGLIFLTSYSALSRISRDPRDKSEDDNYLLVIPVLDTGICKGDVRLKAEHDRGKTSPRMTEERRRSKLGDDSKNFYFVILS